MSFRLPAWARLQVEEQDAEQDAEEAPAGASGGATAQAGPTAVAGDHDSVGGDVARLAYTIVGGCMAAGFFKHVPTRT